MKIDFEQLNKFLFPKNENSESSTVTYVIIDAARIKTLTNELTVLIDLGYENLFMPYEQEKLEEVAPYLIELKEGHDFTTWVYENVYGKQGALFVHSKEQIEELAHHFRPFITTTIEIEHPKKKSVMIETEAYVRFYDPRAFCSFYYGLENRLAFFSYIEKILVEDAKESVILKIFEQDNEEDVRL